MTDQSKIDIASATPAAADQLDARSRSRAAAEMDFFMAFRWSRHLRVFNRIGLAALVGAAGYGVYLAALAA